MNLSSKPKCCLACGGRLTTANASAANPAFHKVCMDDGIDVPLEEGKYTAEQLAGTWAEGRRHQEICDFCRAARGEYLVDVKSACGRETMQVCRDCLRDVRLADQRPKFIFDDRSHQRPD